jgi:hypothetical protein
VQAIKQGECFDVKAHRTQRYRAGKDCRAQRKEVDEAVYKKVHAEWSTSNPLKARAIERAYKFRTSSILTELPLEVKGTVLAPMEFVDLLTVRYNRSLVKVPATCDGRGCRGALFTREHALDCKCGSQRIGRHNAIRDTLGELCNEWKGGVKWEPIISMADERTGEVTTIGDLLVRGVLAPQKDAYIDIRVTNTDASSYVRRTVAAVLKEQEDEKRLKHGPGCAQRRAHFIPFVMSVDGALGPAAEDLLCRLGEGLAAKRGTPLHETMADIRHQMAVASARGTSHCIRGGRSRWLSLGETDDRITGAGQQ